MPAQFPVIVVPDDAPRTQEQLGTKSKFWYDDKKRGLCLFKENRPHTGEDWSEKIAAFLAERLGIPHADYELALWKGRHGVVTRAIHGETERLFLGNELLGEIIPDYGSYTSRRGGNKKHTLENVLRCLSAYQPPHSSGLPKTVSTAAEVFVGYLLLDALIGNTDRHHENWGCIAANNGSEVRLAPSYDHASSMGRELTEVRREEMLTTRDSNRTVAAYCHSRYSRSALYRTDQEDSPMTMAEAFLAASEQFPEAAYAWLARLDALTEGIVREGFDQIPPERLSSFGVECGVRMVSYHRRRLLEPPKGK